MVMVSFKEFVSMVHKYDPLKDQGPIEVRRRSFLNAEHYAQTPISLKRAFTAFFRGNEIVQLSRTDVFNSALNDDVEVPIKRGISEPSKRMRGLKIDLI